MVRTASRPSGFGQPPRVPFIKRTRAALADSARDRAQILRDRALMKLKGHKHRCPRCGKTTRTDGARDRHIAAHRREARAKAAAKRQPQRAPRVPFKGREVYVSGDGRRFRNLLEFNDHARLEAERHERAERRQAERGRRTKAAEARVKRGGRPAGAPKTRTTKLRTPEDKARWHAQRMQMAAGRMDRDGKRIPHPPSPAKVRPRTPTPPPARTARPRTPAVPKAS